MKAEQCQQIKYPFGILHYVTSGNLSILKVFGREVYVRCGEIKQISLLFGAFDYASTGEASCLHILGCKTYMSGGDARWLMGYTWKSD